MITVLPGALHADPWGADDSDLESLNAEVTDAIIEAAKRVEAYAGQPSRTGPPAIVATGPAGAGKTHLFGRLRRKLNVHAVLVHTRPLVGAEMTPRFLLGQLAPQLSRPVWNHPDNLSQLDLVVGGAFAFASRQSMLFPAAALQEVRELSDSERQQRIEVTLDKLLASDPDYDPAYLECLLEVPFASRLAREAKLLWLAGRELSSSQTERAGLKEPLPEGNTIGALRTIAALASRTAPLVIVFDQLENLSDPQGDGALVNAYGNLVADLVDGVRDLVIVQMALDGEWHQRIEPKLQTSHRSRVVGARHTLALPTREQRTALLELWASKLTDPERKPFPWPFTAEQLRAVCDVPGTTPRMLWLELRRVLTGEEPPVTEGASAPPPRDIEAETSGLLAAAWDERMTHARKHLDDRAASEQGAEPAFLLDGLLLLSRILGMKPMKAQGPDTLRVPGGTPAWVVLIHQPHHVAVGAALRRAGALQGGVLALRERAQEWPPTWRSTNSQLAELRRGTLRWHWLDREETVRILALGAFLKDVRSGDIPDPDGKPVSPERATTWLVKTLAPESWSVTRLTRGEAVDDGDAAPPPTVTGPASKPPPKTAAPVVIVDSDVLVAADSGATHETPATRALARLRVASVQRLVRDLSAVAGGTTRAAVLAELRASRRVRWIGDSIVCWVD